MNTRTELREWMRIPEKLNATLELDGVPHQGRTQNISANGVLIEGIPPIDIARAGIITLTKDSESAGFEIRAECEIVRSDGQGTAVRLLALIGEESYAHMRNLIVYNAGAEVEKAEHEFRSHLGLIRRG